MKGIECKCVVQGTLSQARLESQYVQFGPRTGGHSMSTKFIVSVAIAALFVSNMAAHAAEQRISCPLESVQIDVNSRLPNGWWSTPQEGNLKRTTIKTIGGQKTLVCDYKYRNSTISIMRNMPAGMSNCIAERDGFRCSTSSGSSTKSSSSKSSSSGSSSSKSSSSRSSTTSQTKTNAPGTGKGSSSSGSRSCPDLAFTQVFVEQVGPDRGNGHDVVIVAQLVNQGSEDYRSSPDQQQVGIYEEAPGRNPRQVAIEDIGGRRDGEMLMRESGAIRYTLRNWRASDEFPPSYRFQLKFDPDILRDGNSANDDCKAGNNEITISGEKIISAIRRGV